LRYLPAGAFCRCLDYRCTTCWFCDFLPTFRYRYRLPQLSACRRWIALRWIATVFYLTHLPLDTCGCRYAPATRFLVYLPFTTYRLVYVTTGYYLIVLPLPRFHVSGSVGFYLPAA